MNSCTPPSGYEFVTLASTLSCIISKNLSPDDIALLGSFLTILGDNLSAIAAFQSVCEDKNGM